MSEVVHARLDRELLSKVDSLIERGAFPNRSGLIREATREVVSKLYSQAVNEKLGAVARSASAVIADKERERVSRILLYGSVARREATEDSDIDLLILAKSGVEKDDLLRAVVDVTSPVSIATETMITPLVMSGSEFDSALADGFGFESAVAREGIVLYDEAGGS